MSTRSSPADPYAPWRNPNYRLFSLSWFLLTFSKQIETLTVGVNLYDRTGDPLALGFVGLVQVLPVFLLAIAGGQIADRFDRRRVMLAMLSFSTLISAGMLLVSLYNGSVLWMYLLLALGAATQAIGSPSRASLLPQLVGEDMLGDAITWSSTVFHIASLTGPAVGGLILGFSEHAAANAAGAFACVLACRFFSLLAMAGVSYRRTAASAAAVTLQSLVAGIRFVGRTKLILATITLDLFAVLLGGATYLLPIYAKDILQVGATGLGFLRSAEAVGAICMAVLIAHAPPMRRAGWTMLIAVAGFGAATIVFGVSQWYWLSLAMMFLIGAFDNVSVVVRHTLVQLLTPDEMRGRVSAVNNVFIVASNDLGGLESGVTAWLFGPVASVVAGGVGAILVVVGVAGLWPEILSIGALRDLRPIDRKTAIEDAENELAGR